MRRGLAVFPLIALVLGQGPFAPAAAQTPRVSLTVTLWPQAEPNGARRAQLQVRDLLADPRWSNALDQSFPIRLSFSLEIWRSQGLIDEFQRHTEWYTVIQSEPLSDQYRVTRVQLSGPEEFRFTTRDELQRWIGAINLVDALPVGTGTFYYKVTLSITALSDADMQDLERFLAGDTERQVRPGSSLGRSLRRFLLRLAGLPWEELEVTSEKFTVTRKD